MPSSFGQYANLDFDQIKQSIRDYLGANSNFTDYDFEGSNLSVIIDALAYNTYTTAYNTNMAVNESFLDSATLRENVVSLARNIGYVPRSRRAARAKISFLITGIDSSVTVTLKAGLICNGVAENSNFIFSLPEDITVNVVNGIARFNDIEIYEGMFINNNFTVNTAQSNQRFVLPNPFIDTSTLKIKVKPTEASTTKVTYTPINNIIGITSTSSSYLIQEIEDEKYEVLFGDGIIGKKLENNNYIQATYVTTSGRGGNGASEFSFVGTLVDQDNAAVDSSNVSLVTTTEVARDGDNVESITSVKYYAPRVYAAQYRAVTASDYETVLGQIFPNIESVTAYGGEELTPPKFGKVFISAKPRNGDYLSDFTKRELTQKLKNYSVAGIVPEFIDLKYLFVELDIFAYYNTNCSDDPETLKSVVSNALTQYAGSADINQFGGRLRYSKIQTLIDGVSTCITSNITRVIMRRNLQAEIGKWAQYELCFGGKFHVEDTRYNIISTGFIVDGIIGEVFLADEVVNDKRGNVILYNADASGEVNIVKKNIGTVKYDIGEILIDTINITSTTLAGNIIEVQAIPESNDVVGLRDLYVKLDMTNTSINMVPDVISSGENTSGSRFTRESSYSYNEGKQKPKVIRSSNSSTS